MTSIGTGYDLSSSTYSPDGRIFQVEYANKAVDNAGTAIGLKCKDGVVLAIEKLVQSKLLVKGSNRKIQTVDMHIGIASSGLHADGRHLVGRAREEAVNWRNTYKQPVSGRALVDRLSMYVQAYTLYSSVRPFGSSTIIGAVDKDGPCLYMIEPSGVYYGYHAVAVGKGKQVAKTELEKLKLSEMTCRDAIKEAARMYLQFLCMGCLSAADCLLPLSIHVVHDEAKDKEFELELSWVCAESNGKHAFVPAGLAAEAEAWAKNALNPDEMEA
ncbi:putative proteasome subunit alpha type-7 [Sorochytrium milnesiophthora]